MPKQSIKAAVRDAVRADASARRATGQQPPDGSQTAPATADSFVNFRHKLGIGADNPLSSSSYGFNPITRNHVLLEWIHRGSWIGGVAVDVVADDMTRAGVQYKTELEPEDGEKLDAAIQRLGVWNATNETIKWGRLYGGSLGVMLIEGQELRTPFRIETVGKNQFKGLLVLDRWMVEPVIEDLVTDLGPSLGLPKYYRIQANAPALRGQTVHYTRCAFRQEGIRLPYNQRLTENLWGISVIERLYDRMVAYDSASTGSAQLIYKSYLRTLSIKGMREIVAAGGKPLDGLVAYTNMMRQYQGIEGITLIDGDDKFEAQSHTAFSGLSDAMMQFAQQLSGALQIPLTRLFGQSPAGLNATGDNDMRNYYDHIKQRQQQDLHAGITAVYRCAAQSEGISLPDNFCLDFTSLWQLTETDKASIAKTDTETTLAAEEAGLISPQVSLRELRQSSRVTGRFTNVTEELIDAAEEEVQPPVAAGAFDPTTGEPVQQAGARPAGSEGKKDAEVRPQGSSSQVGQGKARRRAVQQPSAAGS